MRFSPSTHDTDKVTIDPITLVSLFVFRKWTGGLFA
jgi:hypothetical protein